MLREEVEESRRNQQPTDGRDAARHQLTGRTNPDRRLIKSAVTELTRALRDVIDGPIGRKNAAISKSGDRIRAGFITQCLLPDDHHRYRFGEALKG